MIDRGRHNVLGIMIDAVDYEAAVERIVRAARESRPLAASALAVHGVMTGVLDDSHRQRLNSFDLIVPDGQPVRWAIRRLHKVRLPDRVYGPELMLRLCATCAEEELPICLFGGTEQPLQMLQERLCARFPRLRIAAAIPSKFRRLLPEESDQLVDEIRQSGAAVTFVGLGCPRQEIWTYEFRERLQMPVVAVGAAFNFHAGIIPQAPPRMQAWGLEWLYRFLQEPRRLWKRYLLLNPLYLSLLALQFLGLKRFEQKQPVAVPEMLLYG